MSNELECGFAAFYLPNMVEIIKQYSIVFKVPSEELYYNALKLMFVPFADKR